MSVNVTDVTARAEIAQIKGELHDLRQMIEAARAARMENSRAILELRRQYAKSSSTVKSMASEVLKAKADSFLKTAFQKVHMLISQARVQSLAASQTTETTEKVREVREVVATEKVKEVREVV